ncbi:hypothetical protein F4859DRAFT_526133 [Xylaria cf. heliscus]|nr:hypothetical protein F4859DRAFT_526133 [Xylaria cf. heliscus]
MTTAGVPSPLAIPGLHQQPTLDDMHQPQVAEVPIIGLTTLIKEFNLQNKFSLHLVHGHMKMAKGMAMVGKPMNNLPGLWIHQTAIDQLGFGALHGYEFVLGADSEFHPYEFRQGPPPPMTANDNAFIDAAQN